MTAKRHTAFPPASAPALPEDRQPVQAIRRAAGNRLSKCNYEQLPQPRDPTPFTILMNANHSITDSNWYAVETLPRAEARSQQHLERQNFQCFCPRFRTTRRHARRVEQVLAPLFPGYLFVRFDRRRDQWRAINGTIGVKRLVGSPNGAPQPMPPAAMEALFARCDQQEVKQILGTMRPGQTVRVISGPFADQLAQIQSLDEKGRVRILLEILGGSSPVDVQYSDVGPV